MQLIKQATSNLLLFAYQSLLSIDSFAKAGICFLKPSQNHWGNLLLPPKSVSIRPTEQITINSTMLESGSYYLYRDLADSLF